MNQSTAVESAAVLAAEQSVFVTVPAVTLPSGHVEPSFHVGQYFCSMGTAGLVVVTAAGAPLVNINYHESVAACIAAGFALITETQALAIAFDIAGVAANWTSGTVGVGKLKQGLRNGTVDEAQPGTYVPEDADEDRWFTLSNGERICDAAGNLFGWIFDNVQGDARGIIARAFAADSPSIATAPHASLTHGMGWRPAASDNGSGSALIRGGFWGGGDYAGVFCLVGGWPDYVYDRVGFRCTKPA